MNGIHYEEIQCFATKASMRDDVLGIPIDFTVNPKTKQIDYMYSTMDLVSHSAYAVAGERIEHTMWGECIPTVGSYTMNCSVARITEQCAYNFLFFVYFCWFLGEKFKTWLPVYLSAEHFEKAMPLLPGLLRTIVANSEPPRTPRGGNGQYAPRRIDSRQLLIDNILHVFPKLMNTMVVLLVDKGTSIFQRGRA